ncbi:MAG: hypothetical protein ACE5IW_13750 [bacterium]
MNTYNEISFGSLNLGAGLGLRDATPADPLATGWGITDSRETQYYLTAGLQ